MKYHLRGQIYVKKLFFFWRGGGGFIGSFNIFVEGDIKGKSHTTGVHLLDAKTNYFTS